MMKSLAVKYRPNKFEDVVAQDSIITILKRQLETDNIKNSYLFCGSSGCVDKDTEFFTGFGWKKISEYKPDDLVLQYNPTTMQGELVKPLEYIKEPCSHFFNFKTKYGINMRLSDEHTMYYKVKGKLLSKPCYQLVEQHNKSIAGFKGKFITTFEYSGKGIELSDSEIKVMCAVICDGSFKKESNTNRCYINIKKERKIERLKETLDEAGIEYNLTLKKNGYALFKFEAPRKEKEFTEFWYNCSKEQLQIVCDNILFWDGCTINNRKSFSQKSKATIDFLQFAFTTLGFRASVAEEHRYNVTKHRVLNKGIIKDYFYEDCLIYRLTITTKNSSEVGLGKSRIKKIESEDGFKYCFTVPSHMWIMRRGGNICITGNCGKTTIARIFSDMINKGIGSPIEIDGASNNGVDNVKQIIKEASSRALDGEYKIYIIDECHMLTPQAWNALLKLIEEPPKYTIFLFCTTDPQKIPSTILNRVMRFNINRISSDKIKERLEYISTQEGFLNYHETCDYISRVCNNQMRDAISLLEKCACYSNNLSVENAMNALGNYSYDTMRNLLLYFLNHSSSPNTCEEGILNQITSIYNNGGDLKVFIDQFLSFVLDIAKYEIAKKISITRLPSSMEESIKRITGFTSARVVYSQCVDGLLELKNALKYDNNIKDTIEIKLIQLARSVEIK